MDDVAAEAQFSKPTLYRYFPSKADLVSELIIHFMEDVEAGLTAISRRPAPPRDKLLEAVRFAFRYLADRENLTRLFVADVSSPPGGSSSPPAAPRPPRRRLARRIRNGRGVGATQRSPGGSRRGFGRTHPERVVLLSAPSSRGTSRVFWNELNPISSATYQISTLSSHGIAAGNTPRESS
jgi:AcrR family transcriptional regulator